MKPIPTFILEHWIHGLQEVGMFELFVRGGQLYGRNFPMIDEEADLYKFDLKTGEWIKVSKEEK